MSRINGGIYSSKDYNLIGNEDSRKKALEQALRTREFEIDLYWRRTTYFWAFIASIYFAYFHVLKTDELILDEIYFIRPVALIVLSLLGAIFSIAWFMANKGSKFWQKNWEMHVGYLEDEFIGPLYKTYKNEKSGSWWKPTEDFDYSVSRINLFISCVVMFSSFIFFVWNFSKYFSRVFCSIFCQDDVYPLSNGWNILIALVVLAIVVSAMLFFCRGNKGGDSGNQEILINHPLRQRKK